MEMPCDCKSSFREVGPQPKLALPRAQLENDRGGDAREDDIRHRDTVRNQRQGAWSPATAPKILSELDARGLIPDLSGACVYVAGVSARSADIAESIGHFWQAYFQRTGADMDLSRYAHVLLHWPPSKACPLE